MASDQDGWYIAEPDGTTSGPMSRADMLAAPASGQYSNEALAWHVDVAEWHPLLKVAAASGAGNRDPSEGAGAMPQRAAPQAGFGAAEAALGAWSQAPSAGTAASARAPSSTSKDERRAQKQRARQALRGAVDDGRRLLSQPQSRETVEAAKAKANAAWAERKAATAAQPGKPSAAPAAGSDRAALAKTANSAAIVGRRLLARLLDSATLGIVGGALLWGVLRSLSLNGQVGPVAEAPPLLLLVILAFVALVPIEALALAFTGTTPGKAWLGLSVRRSDGSKPSILSAWRRSLEVLWRGLAFGIPLISLVTLVVALVQIINQGAARWDTNNGLELRAAPLASGRFQIAAFALVGLWLLLSSDSFPKLVLEIANAPWVFGR